MRRSAAPSLHSSAKRLRFMSPFINSSLEIDKENDLLAEMEPDIAEDFKQLNSDENKPEKPVPLFKKDDTEGSNMRSTSEILQLILGTGDFNEQESQPLTQDVPTSEVKVKEVTHHIKQTPSDISQNDIEISRSNEPAASQSPVCHYNVLWCKRSGKKHKIWEGDGILIVKNRSAILKNSEGKEIDRGMGYKLKDVSALEDGSKFCVGGKECEIQSIISSEDYPEEKQPETKPPLSLNQQTSFKNSKRKKSCM